MSQAIIDLDVALAKPLKVRLAGQTYTLPGDIPAPLYLAVTSFADAGEGEVDERQLTETIYGELLALFRVHQPELVSLPIGLAQLAVAVPKIYGGADEEGGAPPRKAASTRSTKSKKRTSSASSS